MNTNGDFWEINKLPSPLKKSELDELFIQMNNGSKKARDIIIEHNIRLVLYAVNKFLNVKCDKSELVSIGNLGLIKAVNTFDVSKNNAFTTYATKCINNEILKFLRQTKRYQKECSLNDTVFQGKDGKEITLKDKIMDDFDIEEDYEKKELYQNLRKLVYDLPEKKKKIAIMYFGFCDNHKYSQKEIADELQLSRMGVSKLIKEIINTIRQQLDEQDNGKAENKMELYSIYETCKDYTKEQVDEVISTLSEEEKALITLRYGDDLSNPVAKRPLSKSERIKFYSALIPKIKRRLANKFVSGRKIISIYETCKGYTKEQVDEVISTLSDEEKSLIALRYGDDLSNPVAKRPLSKSERIKFYSSLLPRIKRKLANKFVSGRKIISIYETCKGYTKEQVDEVISTLSDEEKELITLRYGDDLSNPVAKRPLSKSERSKFYSTLLPKIKGRLASNNNEKAGPGRKISSIYETCKGYTKEQVDEVISTLSDEEKELITLRYGDDLSNPVAKRPLSKSERSKFYSALIPKIKGRLASNNNEKAGMGRKISSIYEICKDYTKEQVDEVISTLSDEEKALITLRYGDDLSNSVAKRTLSENEKIKFYSALIPKIKRRLASNNNEKAGPGRKISSIYEICKDYTKEQVDEVISTLSDEEKALITLRYGDDLSNPVAKRPLSEKEKNKFYSELIPKIKREVNINQNSIKQEKMTKEDYINVLELLKTPTFGQMMNALSIKEAVVISLRFGYIDGKYFSVKAISEFLGMDREEVIEITKKALLLYKDNINDFLDNVTDIISNKDNVKILSLENKK